MTTETLTIRLAHRADRDAVARVAALDSSLPPRGDVLVAESGGEIVAAIAIESGHAVADPFRRTAAIVHMLRVRRAALHEARRFSHTGTPARAFGAWRPLLSRVS